MPYEELISELAPLETFDPKAFISDDNYPQDLCDFVLCLALAYNDFRDVVLAQVLLNEVDNAPKEVPSTRLGQNVALRQTVMRVQVGFIHELLKLLEANKHVIGGPSFNKVFKQMGKEAKQAWTSIYDVVKGKSPNDKLARVLVRIRNKISFHYDARELAKGYISHFTRDHPTEKAFISRGGMLKRTRFYFADAAIEGCFNLRVTPDDDEVIEFLFGGGNLLNEVNLAIYEIVTRFIQLRSPYKRFETDR